MQSITKRISQKGTARSITFLSAALAGAFALSACGDSDGNGDGDGEDASGGTSNGTGGDDTGETGSGGKTASGGANLGGMDAGGQGGMGGTEPTDRCDSDNGGIDLPDGFCAVVAAESLGHARHLTVTPSGDVFVAVNPAPDGSLPGNIVGLRDSDDDGKFDQKSTFNTVGGNSIIWRDGELFFAEKDRIIKYTLPDGELEPTGEAKVIVSGLPASGDHYSKTIVFSDDETMFVNIGSASNSCQEANRQLESPGNDPCLELEERAGVWVFDPTVLNQTAEDGERYAIGTRNLNALALQPKTNDVWGVMNGRDQLYENWPDYYDPQDDARLPSERLLRLQEGDDYGWPYCYHDPDLGMVLAPEYGGDGETVGDCDSYSEAVFAFPGHWAPLGAVFYEGTQFPNHYRDGLFVAFHGSRFEPNATGDLPGYQVAFLPIDGDEAGDEFETFASGFAGPKRPLPEMAESRPVGVTVANDGSLYITDDHGGKLWRVFYTGD